MTRFIPCLNPVPASQTIDILWSSGYASAGTIGGSLLGASLPYPMLLNGNENIASNVENIQAGDQISNIQLFLQRWVMQTI